MKILAIRFGRVGDVILVLNVLRIIKEHDRKNNITFLTDTKMIPILKNDPDIDKIVAWDRNKWKKYKFNAVKEILKNIILLRKEKFDVVIDFQNFFETGLLSFLVNAKKRIGFERKYFYNTSLKKIEGIRHDIVPFIKLVEAIGIKGKIEKLKVYTDENDKKFVESFLEKNNIKRKEVIGINPCASVYYKRYPEELFATLADKIYFEYKLKSIIFYGPNEYEIAKNVARKMKTTPIISPPTNLSQLAEMIKVCKIFITNDSGPMHIASCVDVPILAIFFKEHSNPLVSSPIGDCHKVLCISQNELENSTNAAFSMATSLINEINYE
jgi:ADP-heptose:LPS heptosyltransferase